MTTDTGRYSLTLNRRGQATRTAFLNALAAQLRVGPWREVTVSVLAAAVGASPATFYCYWPTLDAAALDLCRRFNAAGELIPRHVLLLFRLLEFEARSGRGGGE